jgi:hypothetical protein
MAIDDWDADKIKLVERAKVFESESTFARAGHAGDALGIQDVAARPHPDRGLCSMAHGRVYIKLFPSNSHFSCDIYNQSVCQVFTISFAAFSRKS